jgi:hypothetical protein
MVGEVLSLEIWTVLELKKFKTIKFFSSLGKSKVFLNFFENNLDSLETIIKDHAKAGKELEKLHIFDEIMYKEIFEKLSLDIL